jgi:DNA modification methylase
MLALHPTVKPVALLADAILDASDRGDLVLDPFAGSGSTVMAAHKVDRIAAAMELEPRYVDVTVQRFERLTGIEVRHAVSGLTFAEEAALRQQISNHNNQTNTVPDTADSNR